MTILRLLLLLAVLVGTTVGQNCPLTIHVFKTEEDCQNEVEPDAIAQLYGDQTCRETEVETVVSKEARGFLPGIYSLECLDDPRNRADFIHSGCLYSDCRSTAGDAVCDRAFNMASVYSRLEDSDAQLPISNPDGSFRSCMNMQVTTSVGTQKISFALFGDCTSCNVSPPATTEATEAPAPSPTSSPVKEPAPETDAPVIPPTEEPPAVETEEPSPPTGAPTNEPPTPSPTLFPIRSPVVPPTRPQEPEPPAPTRPTAPTEEPPAPTRPSAPSQPTEPTVEPPAPTKPSAPTQQPPSPTQQPPSQPSAPEPTSPSSPVNPTSPTATTAEVTSPTSGDSKNMGLIFGLVFGLVAALVGFLAVGFLLGKKMQQDQFEAASSNKRISDDMSPAHQSPSTGGMGGTYLKSPMTSLDDNIISFHSGQDDEVSMLEDPTVDTKDSLVGTRFLGDESTASVSIGYDFSRQRSEAPTIVTKESSLLGTRFLSDGESNGHDPSSSSPMRRSNSIPADDSSFEQQYQQGEA